MYELVTAIVVVMWTMETVELGDRAKYVVVGARV